MATDLNTCCDRHPFEASVAGCRHCNVAFCGDCLVYPDGQNRPPLCISCALEKAGVKSRAKGHRSAPRKTRKLFRKEREEQMREAQVFATRAYSTPRPNPLPAPSTGNIDWVS